MRLVPQGLDRAEELDRCLARDLGQRGVVQDATELLGREEAGVDLGLVHQELDIVAGKGPLDEVRTRVG